MMRPVKEDDLHAYVDKLLDGARQEEVRAYLAAHPQVAQRVEGYQRQRQALRTVLAPFAAEPVPPELSLAHLVQARGRRPRISWPAAAAAVLLLAFGIAGGWTMRGFADPRSSGVGALAQEAVYNYSVFGPDPDHAVEFPASDSGELSQVLARRLQQTIRLPDLTQAGYRFMGGRIVATAHGPAALLMYDDGSGTRLGILIRRMEQPSQDTPMSQHASGWLANFSWVDQGLGYSVVGPRNVPALRPLADSVRDQSDRTSRARTSS